MITHIVDTISKLQRSNRKNAASTLEVTANRLPLTYVLSSQDDDVTAWVDQNGDVHAHRILGFDLLSFRAESAVAAFRDRFDLNDDLASDAFAARCRLRAYYTACLGKIVVEEQVSYLWAGETAPRATGYEVVRILDQDGGEIERLHRKIGATRRWATDRGLAIVLHPESSSAFYIDTDGSAVWPQLRSDPKTVYTSASWRKVIP